VHVVGGTFAFFGVVAVVGDFGGVRVAGVFGVGRG
jgi:hypothetical protein